MFSDQSATTRRHDVAPYIVWVLVLASVIPWRRGVFFAGSLDPVVVAKALIGVTALAIAMFLLHRSQKRAPIGPIAISLVTLFAAISTIGGLAADSAVPAIITAVRLAIVATTVVCVVRAFRPSLVLRSLLTTLGVLGVLAAISGLATVSVGGRLLGSAPPLNPNDIAMLSCLPIIGLVHEMVIGRKAWAPRIALAAPLVVIIVLTESRTALLALVVAILLVIVCGRKPDARTVIAVILSVPAAAAVVAYTTLIPDLAARGDATGQNIATLSSRTIAWSAVLSTPSDSFERWVGSGLAVRQVPVSGQSWSYQVLDSSWISALAQAGILGVGVMAALVLFVLYRAATSTTLRPFALPVVVFLIIRSFLENGLVDTNLMFILFFTTALLLEAEHLRSASTNNATTSRFLKAQPRTDVAYSGLLTR